MQNNPKSWLAKRHQQAANKPSTFSTIHSKDLVNLTIGDPDFHTPEAIIEAACADAKAGHTHYTNPLGQQELREAICQDLAADYQMTAAADECLVTTSGCHAMWLVLETLLDKGDEVIVFSPYFTPYLDQIKLAGGVAVECPADVNNAFDIDFEKLNACITEKTKAIIINTPNNPTGQCYSKETLTKLGQIAQDKDLLILADDIYTAFCYREKHIAIASLPNMAERTVTVGSFSKNYCMTGWRIGYVVGPKEIINTMSVINQCVIFSAPTISQRAALHAIALKSEVQPQIVETLRQRAEFAHQAFNSLNHITCLPTAGGMYVFPNVSQTGMNGIEFANYALEKAQVKVIAGEAFGQAGAGHIRVALTIPNEQLAIAIERLDKLLK